MYISRLPLLVMAWNQVCAIVAKRSGDPEAHLIGCRRYGHASSVHVYHMTLNPKQHPNPESSTLRSLSFLKTL